MCAYVCFIHLYMHKCGIVAVFVINKYWASVLCLRKNSMVSIQCNVGFSKVDKKEPIIVKVYFGGLGWIFAKKVSLVMEDFLLYPQSTGKLEAEEKTYPFWNCQIVQLFKNGSLEASPKNMSIWAAILGETTQFIAPTDKLRNYCVFALQISPGICKKTPD